MDNVHLARYHLSSHYGCLHELTWILPPPQRHYGNETSFVMIGTVRNSIPCQFEAKSRELRGGRPGSEHWLSDITGGDVESLHVTIEPINRQI